MTDWEKPGPKHWPGACRCPRCYKINEQCKKCERVFTTYPGLRAHEAGHVRRETKANLGERPQNKRFTPRKSYVVPSGLGYLTRVITNRDGLAAYNLAVVSRFAAALNDKRKLKKRFTKGHKLHLKKLLKEATFPTSKVICELPKNQTISVYQLALAVNANPGDVASLLVSYGLEHLASELRRTNAAPAVAEPNITRTEFVRERTPHQEFLAENFPDEAKPQEVIEIVEYHKPATQASLLRFPSREDDG